MSTSTETLVETHDEAARIFLVGAELDEGAKLDPNDPAITFILNSDDFINLQKYVRACTALSSTEELFEAEFSRENLKKFFDQDDKLYDFMKQVLPRMFKRASEFQINTIEPMIVLGGQIGTFAKDSGRYIETIVASLETMGSPGMVKGCDKYNAAKSRADQLLDRLSAHAKKVENECDVMFKKLTKFKTETETEDLKDILEIDSRLKKIIPDDESKKSKVQKLIDDAKILVDQAKAMLDEEVQKAREQGKAKWYHFIPIVGTVLLIIDIVKHKGLVNSLKELNDRFELEKKKGANAVESITAASHQLEHLTNDIKGVKDTIENALAAVGKMQKTFASLQVMFTDIKTKLGYVVSDVQDEFMKEFSGPIDDLRDAAQVWKRVYALSNVFMSTGLVRDAKDATQQDEIQSKVG